MWKNACKLWETLQYHPYGACAWEWWWHDSGREGGELTARCQYDILVSTKWALQRCWVLYSGVHQNFSFWVGGGGGWGMGLTLWLYNLCLVLKYMLKKSCHNYNCNITLWLHVHTDKYNYMFHDSFTVSGPVVWFNFINLFFKILMYWSSADFSGLFRLQGKSCKTVNITVSTKPVFF
jgi:hypothetical protein